MTRTQATRILAESSEVMREIIARPIGFDAQLPG
jgi:hypothetical protein